MGYPNQLKSARMVAGTPISQGPGKVGEAEQAVADALGIPVNENFGAKVVVSASEKGVANGVATLGSDGKVPAGQLPAGGAFGGAFAYRNTSDQDLAQYSNYLLFNGEKFDTDGYHDNATNPDRITVPAGKAGYYLVTAHVDLQSAIGKGVEVRIECSAGGGSGWVFPISYSADTVAHVSWICYLSVGDYVRVNCWVDSAGAKAVWGDFNNWFSAILLGT